MKKISIFLCIVVLLIIIGMLLVSYINHLNYVNYAAYSVPDPLPTSSQLSMDDTVTISISAVGDCTLGNDINGAGSGSFDSELSNNDNDYTYFFKLVKPYFENDDLTIVNFEGTLSDRGVRAEKEFAFRGNPEYISILTSSSVEAANLSNNHSRDYGETAFSDTKSTMSENNILWFQGKDFTITEINGIKVGLIGVNTQRYDENTGFLKTLEDLKSQNPDLIIANFHWGMEKSSTPDDAQTTLAHAAIDNGVDLVIGHHPHVLQGIEKYKGKYIVYSLGNFCFGGNKNPADKDTMIFKQLFTFSKDKAIISEKASVIPCSISSVSTRNNYQPMPLNGEEFDRVKEKIIDRSEGFVGIENISFIEAIHN